MSTKTHIIYKRCHCKVVLGGKKQTIMGLKKLALLLRRSSLETRLEILIILKDEAHCVTDLIMHTKKSQTAISHHLAILTEAELVTSIKKGKFVEYSLTTQGLRFVEAIITLE